MSERATAAGPAVDSTGVTFVLPDPERRYAAVWLYQEVAWPRGGHELAWEDGVWTLRFARTEVDRFEYLFEVLHHDGGTELLTDAGNPHFSPGPFGTKSVILYPEYQPPAWTEAPEPDAHGRLIPLDIEVPALDARQTGLLWSTPDTDPRAPLPMLVVHDGPEFAQYSGLVAFLDRLTAAGRLPPMRAALLQPIARDDHYSANPAYADALAAQILPGLHALAPMLAERRARVGLGSSLGALALLHAHRTHPATFGALFLQSGSFFSHAHDQYEMGFEHYGRIRRFMERVRAERSWEQPVPVVLACGGVEMNHANNLGTSLALRRQGYDVAFRRFRDAHNWVGWRDTFDPHLVELLGEVWG